MAEIINIKDLREKSLFDLSPEDQKKRFYSFGFQPQVERVLKILVNNYEIKLKAVLDRYENHIIDSSIMRLVEDAARQNLLNMAIYNQLHLNKGDITKEGEEYYRKQMENHKLMTNLDKREESSENEVDEPKLNVYQATGTSGPGTKNLVNLPSDFPGPDDHQKTVYTSLPSDFQKQQSSNIGVIEGDSAFEGKRTRSTYSEVGDELFPKDDNEHSYGVYNSDQELTPDRVAEFAEEIEQKSITNNPPKEIKKGRKRINNKTIALALLSLVAIANFIANSINNSKLSDAEAEEIIRESISFESRINNLDKSTPTEVAELIGPEEPDVQQEHNLEYAIGTVIPNDLSVNEAIGEYSDDIKEYYKDPEKLEGTTDKINNVLKVTTSHDSRIMGNINKANGNKMFPGKAKRDTMKRIGKGGMR